MKETKAILMTVIVVVAVIAFVSSVSAEGATYKIWDGKVSYVNGNTMWTYNVTCPKDVNNPQDTPDISNWIVAWCNELAVIEVKVNGTTIPKNDTGVTGHNWDYVTKYGITGIKIDYDVFKGHTVEVEIRLNGCYGIPSDNVAWVTKANGDYATGTVRGPLACTPIPEFSTIAIPIASILGLLFFFNHRKRREK